MFTTQAASGQRIPDVRRTLRVSALDLFVSGLLGLFSCRWSLQSRRGQQVAEYMILIAGLAMAFSVMSIYTKRGLQARVKQLVDYEIGSQRESNPLASNMVNQTSEGQMQTRYRGVQRKRQLGPGGVITEFDTESTSSGTSDTVARNE